LLNKFFAIYISYMTNDNSDVIRQRTTACQQVIEDCLAGKFVASEVPDKLKDIGISSSEAEDYVEQLEQRMEERRSFENEPEDEQAGEGIRDFRSRENTPEGLDDEERAVFRQRRDELYEEARRRKEALDRRQAVDAAAWALLRAKLSSIQVPSVPATRGSTQAQLAALLGLGSPPPSGVLSSTLLAGAPHLAKLSSSSADPHVERTFKLRQLYATEKAIDAIVDLMQQQVLDEPIPRTLWRDIIQDRFVNFEKLHASMELGYDHQDELKDFHGGFAIVKKDQIQAKRAVRSEAEWIRVFGAWEAGVVLLYPHRASELLKYRKIVMDLFRAIPSQPGIAIRFDMDVRDRYAKHPFRMDDRSHLDIPLFSQMLFSSSSGPSNKRPSVTSSSMSSSKRATVPCLNWNKGFCQDSDLCPNRRLHGKCSECGGNHRAKDNSECQVALQARSRERATDDGRAGPSSRRRA
jgi:hypothetical protein